MATTIGLFRRAHELHRFEPGAVIFREGEPGDILYSVVEGQIEIRRGELLLAVVGPDELLGELALIDHGLRSASAVARTSCVLAPLDEQRFLFMVQHTPYFALNVMRMLAERLRSARARGAENTD